MIRNEDKMDFRWFQPLYTKEISEKKCEKIIGKINRNRFVKNAWLIVLPFGPHNLFDIYPYGVFLQKGFPYGRADVIGLAGSRQDAMEQAAALVEEVYRATGGFDTRAYYRGRMGWQDAGEEKKEA